MRNLLDDLWQGVSDGKKVRGKFLTKKSVLIAFGLSLNQSQKISLYVRIDYSPQTLTPQVISLYARIALSQTPVNSLFKFHLIPLLSLFGRAVARSLIKQLIQAILLEKKMCLVFVIRKESRDTLLYKSSRTQKWQMFSESDRRGLSANPQR